MTNWAVSYKKNHASQYTGPTSSTFFCLFQEAYVLYVQTEKALAGL